MELPMPVPGEDLLQFIDTIGSSAENWYDISSRLLERERQSGDLQAGWVMTAFDYHLARRVGECRKTPAFGERSSLNGQTYPIPVREVPDPVVEFWQNVLVAVNAPAARARLAHLLFERGRDGGANARTAAAAYLELGTGEWTRLDRVACLHWSVELSLLIRDAASAAKVIPELVALAEESLGQEQPEPGVALHALEVLAYEDPTNPLLPGLLGMARDIYRDPFLTGETVRLQQLVARGDDERLAQLRREAVRAYLDHAAPLNGLLRMAFLDDAAKLAARHGFPDLVAEATTAMQAMTVEDLDLKGSPPR